MHLQPEIAVLGTCNLDIINLVSRFATADDEVDIIETNQSLGGSAANFAVALSGMGIKTGILSQVGTDHWGMLIAQELSKRHIDISRLKKSKENTGISFIAVDTVGERSIYNYMGANASFKLENDDVKYIQASPWLHLTGMYIEVIEEASRHARKLSFNPGTILSSFGVDKLENTLKNTNILFLSQKEVKLLTRLETVPGIQLLIDLGVEIVVLTKGEDGASLHTKKDHISVPSHNTIDVMDTTGAGDTFAAGFIAGYLGSCDLEDCLNLGSKTAARHIVQWGGIIN
jgi:ribokinase